MPAREPKGTPRASRVPRGMRRLVIRGETWHWRYGNHVSIRDPQGRGRNVPLSELTGRTWHDLERAGWKGTLRIGPSDVIAYIDRTMLGYRDATGFPADSPWHRHQADIRPGWIPFEGPRGTWQAKAGPLVVDVRSPEDVPHRARIYQLLGLPIEEWVAIKTAAMEADGKPLDYLMAARNEAPNGAMMDRFDIIASYEASSMPPLTPRMLTRHAEQMTEAAA